MKELLTAEAPTLEQQIEFLRRLREDTVRLIKNTEMINIARAIEENLIAVQVWNKAHAKTPSSLVAGVGKAFAEMLSALEEAKELIKNWHNMGMPNELADEAWRVYDTKSPEMQKLNAILSKWKSLVAKGLDDTGHAGITLQQLHDFQSEANEDVFIEVFGEALGQHIFYDFRRNNYQIAIHKLDGGNRRILETYINRKYPMKEVRHA